MTEKQYDFKLTELCILSYNKKGERIMEIAGMQKHQHGTWIERIFTDIHYPCASALSVSSVFNRYSVIIIEDNKPQMNADERRYFPASEFSKIIHRKGRKERKAHLMISFGIRKTTEGTEDTEKRNKTLCSLCSPWLNNLAGINFSGLNARALEYSIFTQGETIEGGTLA